MNSLTIVGNLCRDPELRTIKGSDKTVCCFTVAVNSKRNGETATQFFRANAWGKLADVFAKYATKGMKILVSGPVELRNYTKSDNTEQYYMEIPFIEKFEFLSPGKQNENGNASNERKPNVDTGVDVEDDDLPFE